MTKKTSGDILVYPKEFYSFLYENEQKNFWFWGRNKVVEAVVRKAVSNTQDFSFLEVGCGTGFVLSHLEKLGFEMTGIDIHREGLKFARKRTKASLFCANIEKVKFRKKFDAIGLFDVLEHVDKQDYFLNACSRNLKRRGLLFITVPADMRLWSKIDEVSGHKRRYSKKEAIKILEKNEFMIEKVNYFNFFLFLPQFFLRRYKEKKTIKNSDSLSLLLEGGLKPMPFLFDQLLRLPFLLEAKLINFVSIPFGASLVIVARKK